MIKIQFRFVGRGVSRPITLVANSFGEMNDMLERAVGTSEVQILRVVGVAK